MTLKFTPADIPPSQERIVMMRELGIRLSCSKPTIYARIASGDLPKPLRIGQKVGFLESTVVGYLRSLTSTPVEPVARLTTPQARKARANTIAKKSAPAPKPSHPRTRMKVAASKSAAA